MIIAKNNETKRNKIWVIVITVSSVLIVLIGIFLLTKLFTTNPLEGTWESQDGNMNLSIKRNGSMTAEIMDLTEDGSVNVLMDYVLDKDAKTITIKTNESEVKKTAEKSDGQITEEAVENALGPITTTFDYSVDQGQLTLTEREYGEQLTFARK